MGKVALFIDLDDTLFQTKRKNMAGAIPATAPLNPEHISYMTLHQNIFLNLFLGNESVHIIPTTARDMEQYQRTFLFEHPKVDTAILYFAGKILKNTHEADPVWDDRMAQNYRSLRIPLEEIHARVLEIVDPEFFKIVNVDGYYLAFKNRGMDPDIYLPQNEQLKELLTPLMGSDYYFHLNDKNLSILPRFLDKRYAVEYLIESMKPDLTIGMGDSQSDLSFMHACHFRIFPEKSQIERLLSPHVCDHPAVKELAE